MVSKRRELASRLRMFSRLWRVRCGRGFLKASSGLPGAGSTPGRHDIFRDRNPCLVTVMFSPRLSAASALLNSRKFDGTQTRRKTVPSKQPGALPDAGARRSRMGPYLPTDSLGGQSNRAVRALLGLSSAHPEDGDGPWGRDAIGPTLSPAVHRHGTSRSERRRSFSEWERGPRRASADRGRHAARLRAC